MAVVPIVKLEMFQFGCGWISGVRLQRQLDVHVVDLKTMAAALDHMLSS
jgi:hypothetical protein